MGHSGKVVLPIRFRQTEMSHSLRCQRDVVKTLGCVTYQQTFFLFQIFEGPDHVGICVSTRAIEELLSNNARPSLGLEKSKHVFLDLPQTLFVHVVTPAPDYATEKG